MKNIIPIKVNECLIIKSDSLIEPIFNKYLNDGERIYLSHTDEPIEVDIEFHNTLYHTKDGFTISENLIHLFQNHKFIKLDIQVVNFEMYVKPININDILKLIPENLNINKSIYNLILHKNTQNIINEKKLCNYILDILFKLIINVESIIERKINKEWWTYISQKYEYDKQKNTDHKKYNNSKYDKCKYSKYEIKFDYKQFEFIEIFTNKRQQITQKNLNGITCNQTISNILKDEDILITTKIKHNSILKLNNAIVSSTIMKKQLIYSNCKLKNAIELLNKYGKVNKKLNKKIIEKMQHIKNYNENNDNDILLEIFCNNITIYKIIDEINEYINYLTDAQKNLLELPYMDISLFDQFMFKDKINKKIKKLDETELHNLKWNKRNENKCKKIYNEIILINYPDIMFTQMKDNIYLSHGFALCKSIEKNKYNIFPVYDNDIDYYKIGEKIVKNEYINNFLKTFN